MMYDRQPRVLTPSKAGRVSLPLSFYNGQLKAAGADISRTEYDIGWLYDMKLDDDDFIRRTIIILLAGVEQERYQRRPLCERLAEQFAAEQLTMALGEALG